MHIKTLLATLPIILLGTATASADLVVENFDSRATGALTETGAVVDVFTASNTALTVTEDSGNLFGLGTSNKYLQITDDNASNGPFMAIAFGTLDTADGGADDNAYSIQFDFIDNSTGSGRLNIRGRTSPTDGNNEGFDPRLVGGNLFGSSAQTDVGKTYSAGTLYTLRLDITDEVAGTYNATVLQGNSVVTSITGANFRDNGSNNILDTVTFQSFNEDNGTNVLIDNIKIVPEPASLALMGLGSLLILGRRRAA